MTQARYRLLTIAAWSLTAIAAVLLSLQRYETAAGDPQPDLGGIFLPAAQAIANGESPYTVTGYYYSPLVALLLVPVASTPEAAVEYWTALRIVAGLAACVLAAFASVPRGRPLQAGLVALVGVVTLLWSWPATLDLWIGQVQMIVLMVMTLAAFSETRGWRFVSGFTLGMAAVVKSWPGLFSVWLLRAGWRGRGRQWLGVAAAAALAIVLAAVTGGFAAVADMMRAPFAGMDQPSLAANSVWGLPRLMFSATPIGAPLVVSPVLQVTVTVALLIWVLALGVAAIRRPGPPVVSLFNIAFVIILLLPVSHYVYVMFGLPALWWWCAAVLDPARRGRTAWIAAIVLTAWWLLTFRITPDGDGFLAMTWPSLARVFVSSLVAATTSILCARSLDASARAAG